MRYWLILLVGLLGLSCQNEPRRLPIYGEREAIPQAPGTPADTLYHTIKPFEFVDQDSTLVTDRTFEGSIYVADFFFTTCPTICPRMKAQMLRVYDAYKGDRRVKILSHSINPEYDTVAVLKAYATKLGIEASQWHMVTGKRDSIYAMAGSYLVPAVSKSERPDDITHSGHFILIDRQKRIRGLYNGTDPADVDRLIADIPVLLAEYEHK